MAEELHKIFAGIPVEFSAPEPITEGTTKKWGVTNMAPLD
jgi:hypothetical protein